MVVLDLCGDKCVVAGDFAIHFSRHKGAGGITALALACVGAQPAVQSLLATGQEALRSFVIDDIAGALSERALGLAARRSTYELAEGLAVDGRRSLSGRARNGITA
jgi:hypothetical protein